MITQTDTPPLAESEQSSEESSSVNNNLDHKIPEKVPRKSKHKIKSSGSLSSTPTGFKQFLSNLQKFGSQTSISSSIWTLGPNDQALDEGNKRCYSSLSLNNSISSPTQLGSKKKGWYPKFLSPNTVHRSAESDSSAGTDNSAKKKKKWYRKRFPIRSRSKSREPVQEN